jgi:hypothetical protein
MAKIGLTKLGLKPNQNINEIEFNGQKIEIKEYLPVTDKLDLMSAVVNQGMGGNNFANPVQIEVYLTINVFKYYTNINFTDKQLEEPGKLYDLLVGNGLRDIVFEAISNSELDYIRNGVYDTINALYKYQNSILGVLEAIGNNYSETSFDLENILSQIKDPEMLGMIKQIIPLLGDTTNKSV